MGEVQMILHPPPLGKFVTVNSLVVRGLITFRFWGNSCYRICPKNSLKFTEILVTFTVLEAVFPVLYQT